MFTTSIRPLSCRQRTDRPAWAGWRQWSPGLNEQTDAPGQGIGGAITTNRDDNEDQQGKAVNGGERTGKAGRGWRKEERGGEGGEEERRTTTEELSSL